MTHLDHPIALIPAYNEEATVGIIVGQIRLRFGLHQSNKPDKANKNLVLSFSLFSRAG